MDNVFNVLSFDFMEFATSLEGILMIVGCIFLIIGIVMLLMGKGKKDEAVKENSEPVVPMAHPDVVNSEPVQETVNTQVVNESVDNGLTPSNNNVLENSVITPTVEPINFTGMNTNNTVQPVVPATSENQAPVVHDVEQAKVDVSTFQVPNVEPVQPVQDVNLTQPVQQSVQPPVVPATVVEEVIPPVVPSEVHESTPSVTVYGGVDPNATVQNAMDEKPRENYGGANPLENTAPIPTNTVREAYQGNTVIPDNTLPVQPAPAHVPTPVVNTPVAPAPEPVVQIPNNETVVAPVDNQIPTSNVSSEEIETLEF